MIELARLAEFACAVLEVILVRWLVLLDRERRLPRIAGVLRSTDGVVVFAGFSVFALSGTEVIAAVQLSVSLWVLGHIWGSDSFLRRSLVHKVAVDSQSRSRHQLLMKR